MSDAPPSFRPHRSAALWLLVAYATALVVLAVQIPWTPDEITYLQAGQLLAHELDWEPYITFAHGPLPFYANQMFAWAVPVEPYTGYKVAGRLGMIGFAVLGAFATWRLANAGFGRTAGICALALFALNPLLLGHGSLMATDMSLVGLYVLCLHAAWSWLTTPTLPRLCWIGVTLGAALATKYLAVFLIPVLGLILAIALARGFAPRILWSKDDDALARRAADLLPTLLVCAVAAWITLWACYVFAPPGYGADNVPRSQFLARLLDTPGGPTLLEFLPEPWVRGIDYMKSFAEGGTSYLCGTINQGHWAYYLVAIATMMPIAFLVTVAVGLFGRWPRHLGLVVGVGIVLPLAYLSVFQVLQIGLRHMMQVLPLLCLLGARALAQWWERGTSGRTLVGIVFGMLLLGSAATWPAFIGSFNAFVGDRPYDWFRDSNLTWVGDLEPDPDLEALRARHPEAARVFTASGPRLGTVYVFAPDLCQVPDATMRAHHWLRRFRPVDAAGAWYLFEIDDAAFAATRGADPDLERAALEHAIALATSAQVDRARTILASNTNPTDGRDAVLRQLLALDLAAADSGPTHAAALLALGRFDLVLSHPSATPFQRAFAYFERQQHGAARDALAALAEPAPQESLLLALSHLQLNEHVAAIDVLERRRPPASDPLSPRFATLEQEVRRQYALAKLTYDRLEQAR